MSSSSNKDFSKSENNSDSDYEMSKDDSNERGSSDQTSNDNRYKEEEERKKEKEKYQLADKIKKENENFLHNAEQSQTDRLKFLLNQTKTYANFLMGGKVEDHELKLKHNNSKRKRKNSEAEGNVEDIRILQQKNNVDEDDLKEEKKTITRLLYQPSSLTGGKLTDYQLDGLNGILADEMG